VWFDLGIGNGIDGLARESRLWRSEDRGGTIDKDNSLNVTHLEKRQERAKNREKERRKRKNKKEEKEERPTFNFW
jgi:hypothetical protein